MDRVKAYSIFAIGYCGFGYILLWPLSSPYVTGELFGAGLVCGDRALAPLRWLCGLPHPLRLSLPLQLLGLFSVLAVAVRLVLLLLGRIRRRRAVMAAAAAALAVHSSVTAPPLPRRKPRPRRSTVKPRTHFGLRGMPQ